MKQFTPLPLKNVRLLPGMFESRYELNRKYLLSLRSENLLQNHYLEAGLWNPPGKPESIHWGWESPTCQVHGQFLGHWLSAGGRIAAATQDPEVKGKADWLVAELGRCQRENGGEWVFSIPEKYLDWAARGKKVWAPQYVVHKTLMGLVDMYVHGGNLQALEILENAAHWFHRWSGKFTRIEFDRVLDVETGGMLEAWADLYGITGRQEHLDLVYRYDRPQLFNRLLEGEDPLTNRHANTTIPEAHGAARAYEVTGDMRWRQVVEAYWRCAVDTRGHFCTGGQTEDEIWTPPFSWSARLSETNQEHCTVYNLTRLADYLLHWTGEARFADYMERNLYNGILAQQHPVTGMVIYYLPLRAGSQKKWGTPTDDFWCCHGTLVQAHTTHTAYTYYQHADGLAVCQYIPSEAVWEQQGVPVVVRQDFVHEFSPYQPGQPDASSHRPNAWQVDLTVRCQQPVEFTLLLRLPWWLSGPARICVNGEDVEVPTSPAGFFQLARAWHSDTIRLELPKTLTTCPIPDRPELVAFLDGPVVLAGLCDEERLLFGDSSRPETLLIPDQECLAYSWRSGYRTVGQERGLQFIPLYEVCDECYAVYFPVSHSV